MFSDLHVAIVFRQELGSRMRISRVKPFFDRLAIYLSNLQRRHAFPDGVLGELRDAVKLEFLHHLLRWVSTVLTLTPRSAAISLVVCLPP